MTTPAIEFNERLDEPIRWSHTEPRDAAGSNMKVAPEAVSRALGVPIATIPDGGIDPAIRDLVPAPLAYQYQLVPIRRVGGFLTVAMTDPTDQAAIRAVEAATGLEVLPAVAAPSTILRAIAQVALAA